MKAEPPEIYGWRVFTLACSACFGGMLFSMDIGTIGGVLTLPAFIAKYHLTAASSVSQANLSANIASALQAGCFLGCFIASRVADKSGLRTELIGSGAWTCIGCIF